jgi:hypothetical protein
MYSLPGYRTLFTIWFAGTLAFANAQVRIVSLGLFTGATTTYTIDDGLHYDPRYKEKYNIKFAPIGFNYGVDYEGYGFVISPGLFSTGENFSLLNTVGGHEGSRRISLQYLNVPIAFKVHLIDLDFLKTSFIIGGGPAFLLKGKDEVSHHASKLYFPPVVYPSLPDTYTIEYDGVLAPDVQNLAILKKKDFDPVQVFGFVGIRSDWYFSETWKASFDFRVNYSFFDNRTDDYINRLKAYKTIYDMPGQRKDIVGQFTIGVSRYIENDITEKNKKVHKKSNTKRYIPQKISKPRKRS